MKYQSSHQAMQFFIDKVIAQAELSNIALSETEKYMLKWTELEEDFVVEQEIVNQFYEETTDEEFEAKIKGLLKDAYEFDTRGNQKILETYRDAYNALKKYDCNILELINETIGPDINKLKDRLLLLIIGLILFILFFPGILILGELELSSEWENLIFWSAPYIGMYIFAASQARVIKKKWKSAKAIFLLLFAITVPIVTTSIAMYYEVIDFPETNWRPLIVILLWIVISLVCIETLLLKGIKKNKREA